jgi:beta-lactamase regulating signal transducer with metallopeptidase domain
MAGAHLPPVARQIARRLAVAQEMAADAAAARRAKSPVQVAEALLALARMHSGPALGLSFMHGEVAPRVRALLETHPRPRPWPVQALAVAAVATVVAGAALNEPLHHALETLLGALG